MKFIIIPFILFTIGLHAQTTLSKTITVNSQLRGYRVYIPAIYSGSTSVPLVFNFHGYTSNNIAQEAYGDFRPIADTANFILVHPQGLDIGGGYGWNSFSNTDPSNYDYVFVEQLIDQLMIDYNIDPFRIYSTGLSNGGFLSYDLACFMSDRFAAIASVAGTMVPLHTSLCNPGRPFPVLHIHGTNDPTVSYDGTGGILTSTGVDDLISFWVANNNCETTAQFENIPNINTGDQSTVEHYAYPHPTDLADVELFKVLNGGHTWPGSSTQIPVTNQDMSASKEIWRFFLKYRKPSEINSVHEQVLTADVFPNPTTGKLTLTLSEITTEVIELYDVLGQKLFSVSMENQLSKELDLSSIPVGIYVLKIGSHKERINKN